MLGILKARLQQGYRTMAYPAGPLPELPAEFVGRPVLDATRCPDGCRACEDVCPTHAVAAQPGDLRLDAARCIFCGACQDACPTKAITFSRDHRLAATTREGLVATSGRSAVSAAASAKATALFGRSLKLRQVSAGGCNACEADTNVLSTIGWDLGRFGIQFVASPRHADGLLVTGPVTRNMEPALKRAYDAVPSPKIVIAVGACALSGGVYQGQDETHEGVAGILPVDLFIPGCPPHPSTILDALLRFTGRAVPNSPAELKERRPKMNSQNANSATAICCIDGRIQIPVRDFLKSLWKVDWVDIVTESAPERTLSEGKDSAAICHIHNNTKSSLVTQATKRLAVVSHSGCDCNDVTDEDKVEMVRQSVAVLQQAHPDTTVIGVWIEATGKPVRIDA